MHIMTRTSEIFLGAVLGVATLVGGLAHSQPFPTKTIRLIIPFGPGTGTDTIGRVLAAKLTDELGQSVVVDNRPGASGAIGAELATRATPDGYTLVLSSNGTLAAYPALTSTANYRADVDFTPVALFTRTSMLLITANLPGNPKSVADLVNRMKTSKVTFASNGAGTMGHLGTELFLRKAGLSGTHIPYKGSGQSYTDILRGEVLFMTDTPAAALPLVRAGRLRPLAVTGSARLQSLPDVPTFEESGINDLKQFYTWWGVFGPKNMPSSVVRILSDKIDAAVASPDLKARLQSMDLEGFHVPREKSAEYMRGEVRFWQEFAAQSGIKLDP
jgi:tripartite-type tricarboxylate transporter receptor subunit TctC